MSKYETNLFATFRLLFLRLQNVKDNGSASFWGASKDITETFLGTSVWTLRCASLCFCYDMPVCQQASLIAPRSTELPGKDIRDLALPALSSQWFSGSWHCDLGQIMYCDSFPDRKKGRLIKTKWGYFCFKLFLVSEETNGKCLGWKLIVKGSWLVAIWWTMFTKNTKAMNETL